MILTEWCILVNDKRNGFMIKSETKKILSYFQQI